jgi:RNA polymerase sigma-70 factor, ECF subfamily
MPRLPISAYLCFDLSNFKNRNGGIKMVKINLQKYYPNFYTTDCMIEVPDKVAALLNSSEHAEAAYYLRRYRHKAYYSLDHGDGIEHDILFVSLSPCEIYERKVTAEQLHSAIAALPDKQAKRIYAHYVLGISQADIARAEGVDARNVRKSIRKGLQNMEIFLKNDR